MAISDHFADVEWIARTADVNVRINTLPARRGTPWHYHTVVTDNVFCLEGELQVDCKDPDQTVTLRPGERAEIPPRRVHRVLNCTDRNQRYLLVQATGPYDFNVVASAEGP